MAQRAIVLGAGGQLGRELLRCAGPGMECVGLVRRELDIADPVALGARLDQLAPALVLNAAAYTAVDAAESDAAAARRANALAPAQLAAACRDRGIRLIHVSTDFVFDGGAAVPYRTDAPTAPLGEYGRSKLAGEQAVQRELPGALIMRTGWVYSRFGGNFVKTMLRLMAERDELAVVADQLGTPTWARGLAQALWAAAARPQLHGIYHWSDAGQCSWYEFAVAICEEACALGLLARPVKIRPIATSDYPTAARRPAYSVLDKTRSWRDLGLPGIPWREQLRAMLLDLKEYEDE
ncbi:MAG: dTDP-4-dehydrorhamnose reductase [Halieaceae bacterium]|nr:dTDP-4-dehydrorhamnose reductase [Halieaceae bacterium]